MSHKTLKNNLRLVTGSKLLQNFAEETYKNMVCSRMERRLMSLKSPSEGCLLKSFPSSQSVPHTRELPEENLRLPPIQLIRNAKITKILLRGQHIYKSA